MRAAGPDSAPDAHARGRFTAGRGSSPPRDPGDPDPQRRPRTLRGDLHGLVDRVGQAAEEARDALGTSTRRQPYLWIAVAGAVGFVAGGGLRARDLPRLLRSAGRMAGVWVTREILEATRNDQEDVNE